MAISSKDRKIRLFNVLSGKIVQVIDESLDVYSTIQQVFSFWFSCDCLMDKYFVFIELISNYLC